jgi:hypothetical protein
MDSQNELYGIGLPVNGLFMTTRQKTFKSFVQIPTRIAIGSNLAIVLLSSTAGFIGKAATGQIEWLQNRVE